MVPTAVLPFILRYPCFNRSQFLCPIETQSIWSARACPVDWRYKGPRTPCLSARSRRCFVEHHDRLQSASSRPHMKKTWWRRVDCSVLCRLAIPADLPIARRTVVSGTLCLLITQSIWPTVHHTNRSSPPPYIYIPLLDFP
jgi:hypothetical protein